MTGNHPRRVEGYPVYAYTAGIGSLAAGASSVLTLPTGPGEVLGFGILRYAGSVGDFWPIGFKSVIDGVTVYDNYLSFIAGGSLYYSLWNLQCTNDLQSATISSTSFRFRHAYQSSAVLTFKNNGGAAINIGVGVHSRRGP